MMRGFLIRRRYKKFKQAHQDERQKRIKDEQEKKLHDEKKHTEELHACIRHRLIYLKQRQRMQMQKAFTLMSIHSINDKNKEKLRRKRSAERARRE